MHFMNILQHVPEKILVCVKTTYEKKTTQEKKAKDMKRNFRKEAT